MNSLLKSNTNAMKSSPSQNTKSRRPRTELRFSPTNQMKKSQLETKRPRKERTNKNSPTCQLTPLLKWTEERDLRMKNGLKSKLNTTKTPSLLKRPSRSSFPLYKLDSSKRIKRPSQSKSLNTSNKLPSLSKRDNHGLDYSMSSLKSPLLPQSKPTKTQLRKLLDYAMNS